MTIIVLYNTSGNVNTIQLAWREWTCNGSSKTIEDRIREIKAGEGLCIGRETAPCTGTIVICHSPANTGLVWKPLPRLPLTSCPKYQTPGSLLWAKCGRGRGFTTTGALKRDEDTVTPDTAMSLGHFRQVIKQTFELVLAVNHRKIASEVPHWVVEVASGTSSLLGLTGQVSGVTLASGHVVAATIRPFHLGSSCQETLLMKRKVLVASHV